MDSQLEHIEGTDTAAEVHSCSANIHTGHLNVGYDRELMECDQISVVASHSTTMSSVTPPDPSTTKSCDTDPDSYTPNIDIGDTNNAPAEVSEANNTPTKVGEAMPDMDVDCDTAREATAEHATVVTCDDDYMPAEHLVSDDSDVAGQYCVTADDATASTSAGGSGYQRLNLSGPSSASAEVSSDSDASQAEADDEHDIYDQLLARNHDDSSSSSGSSENATPDLSLLHTGKARVKDHLLQSYWRREYGDRAGYLAHSNYVANNMSNISFVRRLECVKTLNHHEGCVNALSFNQSGTLLASGSDDMKAIIWDMSTYKPFIVFDTGHKSNVFQPDEREDTKLPAVDRLLLNTNGPEFVFQTKFMPYSNDSQLVTCARDGQVRLSDLSTTGACRGSKRLALHKGSAHKLAVEYDTSHCLMSAGEDAVVYEIDLRQPKPNKLLLVRNGRQKIPLHSIDINPSSSQEFLVSGKDHFIRLYDRRRLPSTADNTDILTLHKFYPHRFSDSSPFKRDVTCAVYNYNGSEVLGTYNDDDIYLFNNGPCVSAEGGSPDSCRVFTGHRNSATVKGVSFFGARSEYVVSGSDCGNVFIWDKQSTQLLQLQKGDELGVVNILEPHPSFPYLATSGLDNDIKLFMPVAEDYVDLNPHAKTIKKNISDRSRRQPEEIDGQLLWLVMQQLQRARRRRQRQAAGEDCENSSDSSDSSSSDDDTADPTNPNINCITS